MPRRYAPRNDIIIVKYKKTTLKNGLRIITAPMKGTQTVTVVAMIGVGSRYETDKQAGLSHFTEHMLFKGTKKRPDTIDITGELDSIGGDYNAFTTNIATGYHIKVDYKHLENALDIVSDIYLNSKIDSKEIEREKGTIIQELNMIEDVPMKKVSDIFYQLLYKNNSLGRDIIGSKKTVASFKRRNFINFTDRFYKSNNTVICVSGKFNEKKLISQIKKYFSGMKKGKKPKFEKVIEKQTKPEIKIKYKKTDQTHFILGNRAYNHSHKNRFALSLLSIILGGNMSSRLFIEVRERKGLAYYVRTGTEEYQDCGYIATQAGVEHKNLGITVKTILKEYRKITEKEVSKKELKKAVDYIKGKSIMGFEASDAVAMFFTEQELIKGRVMTMEEIFEKIDKVTVSDIQRVARDIFKTNKLNLAVIGPHKNADKFKNSLKL